MIQLPWNNLALTKSALPLYRVHLCDWRRWRMRGGLVGFEGGGLITRWWIFHSAAIIINRLKAAEGLRGVGWGYPPRGSSVFTLQSDSEVVCGRLDMMDRHGLSTGVAPRPRALYSIDQILGTNRQTEGKYYINSFILI